MLGELPSSLWGHRASIAKENDPVLQLIAWSTHTNNNMMPTWPSQQSTPYGAWVGSTLVRNSHNITQERREGCTDGLFFASGTSGAGAVWGYGCGGVAAQVWMTLVQLNDVSLQCQKSEGQQQHNDDNACL